MLKLLSGDLRGKLVGRVINYWSNDLVKGTVISCLLMVVFSSIQYSSGYLMTNLVLEQAKNIVFTGTVMPYPETVDFEALPQEYRDADFSDVPKQYKIPLVKYNASEIATSFTSRQFVNAKITYTVPYLGTYELDGRENVGSHPAVDIVALRNTPVQSVANGVVLKAINQDIGFGPHVVILHPNVPDPDNPGQSTNLISSYSHLNSFIVSEGDVVNKGQLIGYVGKRGFATTNHVHFQIDRERVGGWYPSWPFTADEAQKAGLSFVDAVNKGLNIDRARELTVHPMNWVQQWLNVEKTDFVANSVDLRNSSGATLKPVDLPNVAIEESIESPMVIEVATAAEEIAAGSNDNVASVKDLRIDVELPSALVIGKESKFTIKLLKPNGEIYPFGYRFTADPLDVDNIGVDVDFRGGLLAASNFVNGVSQITFIPEEIGNLRFKVKNSIFNVESDKIQVRRFSDVDNGSYEARVLDYLQKDNILSGYDDSTFRPNNNITRIEALKLIVKTLDISVKGSSRVALSDDDLRSWYKDYLAVGIDRGLIGSNNELRLDEQVNWWEFIKMLITALEIDLDPRVDTRYMKLIDVDSWYAPYWQEAIRLGLVTDRKSADEFRVNMTRFEVAEVLYKLK